MQTLDHRTSKRPGGSSRASAGGGSGAHARTAEPLPPVRGRRTTIIVGVLVVLLLGGTAWALGLHGDEPVTDRLVDIASQWGATNEPMMDRPLGADAAAQPPATAVAKRGAAASQAQPSTSPQRTRQQPRGPRPVDDRAAAAAAAANDTVPPRIAAGTGQAGARSESSSAPGAPAETAGQREAAHEPVVTRTPLSARSMTQR